MEPDLIAMLRCPEDAAGLREDAAGRLACARCGQSWPVSGGAIFFKAPPGNFVAGGEVGEGDRESWSAWRRENFSFLRDGLASRSGNDILIDIGAGVNPFREVLGRFKNAVGVDFYPYPGVALVADITGPLPFRDAWCDIVVMANVLEHIATPLALLRECHRILKPGGLLIGTVPFLMELHMAPYDFLRYTPFMLRRLLVESGFASSSVQALGTPANVYQTMQRQFFDRLIHTEIAGPRRAGLAFRFFARLSRKLAAIQAAIFAPIFNRAGRSDAYTEGYGFMAWK